MENRPIARLGRVLVATDFSAGAAQALERAARLPLAPGATLHLAHVLPEGMPRSYRREAAEGAKERLDQLAARTARLASRVGNEVRVEPVLLTGRPFVELIHFAREKGIELVVLGRKQRRRFRDLFVGSTGVRVIRKGETPVLVVAARPRVAYRKPLVALDLSEGSVAILEMVARVLEPPRPVPVVHAYDVPFEARMAIRLSQDRLADYRGEYRIAAKKGLHRLLDRSAGLGIPLTPVLRRGDPRMVILKEITRRRADLLAIGTHGKQGVASALLGSVAEWVVQSVPCDVLVARPEGLSVQLP